MTMDQVALHCEKLNDDSPLVRGKALNDIENVLRKDDWRIAREIIVKEMTPTLPNTGLPFGPLACVVVGGKLRHELKVRLQKHKWSERGVLWETEEDAVRLQSYFWQLHNYDTFDNAGWKVGYLPLGYANLYKNEDVLEIRYQYIWQYLFRFSKKVPISLYNKADNLTKSFIRRLAVSYIQGMSRWKNKIFIQHKRLNPSRALDDYDNIFKQYWIKLEKLNEAIPHLTLLSVLAEDSENRLRALNILKNNFPGLETNLLPNLEAFQRLLCEDTKDDRAILDDPVICFEEIEANLAPFIYCANLMLISGMGLRGLIEQNFAAGHINTLAMPDASDLYLLNRDRINALAMCRGSKTARETMYQVISKEGLSEVERNHGVQMLASMWEDEVVTILADILLHPKSDDSYKAAVLDAVVLVVKTNESFRKDKKKYRVEHAIKIQKINTALQKLISSIHNPGTVSEQLTLSILSFIAEFSTEDTTNSFIATWLLADILSIQVKALRVKLLTTFPNCGEDGWSDKEKEEIRNIILQASQCNHLQEDLSAVLKSLKDPVLVNLACDLMTKEFRDRLLEECSPGNQGSVWSFLLKTAKNNMDVYAALLKKALSLDKEDLVSTALRSTLDRTISPRIMQENKMIIRSCMYSHSPVVAGLAVCVCERYFLNDDIVRQKILDCAMNQSSVSHIEAGKCIEKYFSIFFCEKNVVEKVVGREGISGIDVSVTNRLIETVKNGNYISINDILFNLSKIRIYSHLLKVGEVDPHWNHINPIIHYLKVATLAFSPLTKVYKDIKQTFFACLQNYQTRLSESENLSENFSSPLQAILEPTKIPIKDNRPGIPPSLLLVQYLGFSRIPDPPLKLQQLFGNLSKQIFTDLSGSFLFVDDVSLGTLIADTREKVKAIARQARSLEDDAKNEKQPGNVDNPMTPVSGAIEEYLRYRSSATYANLVKAIDEKLKEPRSSGGAGSRDLKAALSQAVSESIENFFWRHCRWYKWKSGSDCNKWYPIVRQLLHDFDNTWEHWDKLPKHLFVRRLLNLSSTATRLLIDHPEKMNLREELNSWMKHALLEYGQVAKFTIKTEYSARDGAFLVTFDRLRFRSILNNCLTNALASVEEFNLGKDIEHKREGKIILAVQKIDGTEGIQLTFTDNGKGFTPECIKSLAEGTIATGIGTQIIRHFVVAGGRGRVSWGDTMLEGGLKGGQVRLLFPQLEEVENV